MEEIQEAPEEMEPSDEMICVLLVQGRTHAQISAELGISTKTIQRRLQLEWFADEVRNRRRAAVAATAASLEQLSSCAVSALSDLLASENEQIRLRAIDLILKSGRQFHREDVVEGEILERLEAIETLATAEPDDILGPT